MRLAHPVRRQALDLQLREISSQGRLNEETAERATGFANTTNTQRAPEATEYQRGSVHGRDEDARAADGGENRRHSTPRSTSMSDDDEISGPSSSSAADANQSLGGAEPSSNFQEPSTTAKRFPRSSDGLLNHDRTGGESTNSLGADDLASAAQPGKRWSGIRAGQNARDIYILGYGNVGQLIGHSLAGIPDPPRIIFLFNKASMLIKWQKQGQTISIERQGMVETRGGFRGQVTGEPPAGPPLDHEIIMNLVVAVKAHVTIKVLRSVAHRLSPLSTVFFLQNGMGTIEEVNRDIFPDPKRRPSYMFGILNHALYRMDGFKVRHTYVGTIAMTALLPTRDAPLDPLQESIVDLSPSTLYMLRTFARTPGLGAVGIRPFEFRLLQLEKLATNCIINPLSVIYECPNGELLNNFAITKVIRLLLAEISLVIRSLPEVQAAPNLQARFAPMELEYKVFALAAKTAANISSMLQDYRVRGSTELDYLNGYIVRRGEELGIKCVMNFLLIQMVKGKMGIASNRAQGLLPVVENQWEDKLLEVEGDKEAEYLAMREASEK